MATSDKEHANTASQQGSSNPDKPLTEAEVDSVQNTDLVEQRLEQICEAALKLFLEKGFAATTIRDICAASGVNQASIYDYVANKNDILRRIFNKVWFRPDMPTLGHRLQEDSDLPLQENIANYYRDAWSKKRDGIILAYRTVPHMQPNDRRVMREREQSVADELAEELAKLTDLPADGPEIEVTAQIISYLAAFAPMRDWLLQADDEATLRVVAAGTAAMIEQLGKENNKSDT